MLKRTQTPTTARRRGRFARRSAAALATIALAAPAGAAARPIVFDPAHGSQAHQTSGSPHGVAVAAGVLGATLVLGGAGAAVRARRPTRGASGGRTRASTIQAGRGTDPQTHPAREQLSTRT
jgi:hypothetical protein